MDIKDCLRERFLIKIKPEKDLVQKELKEANYDFSKAKKAFFDNDWKWSIIKSYYCIFHSARAILFRLGFREKRHFAIKAVLEDLNKNGKLEGRYINDFSSAMSSREDADYNYLHSKERSEHSLNIAREFMERMKRLLSAL